MTTPTAARPRHDAPTGSVEWSVWTTMARLVLTRPEAVSAAERLVRAYLAKVDAAASRFRDDSEVSRLEHAEGRPMAVSPLLAELVAQALRAARRTDGAVDPTLGGTLRALGYPDGANPERTGSTGAGSTGAGSTGAGSIGAGSGGLTLRERPDWRQITLEGDRLTVPAGVLLDLGATAKAYAADVCADRIARELDTGVLVSLGGDIATAGPAPAGGWRVTVQDGDDDPSSVVILTDGALATSSTVRRSWYRDGDHRHHIIDPRSGVPVRAPWRTVTVAARRCVDANTASTATLVKGLINGGQRWLRSTGLPARLVDHDRNVITMGGWPARWPG